VNEARQRIARKTTACLAFSALAVATFAAVPALADTETKTACVIEDLPLPDGVAEGQATGGDPTGHYLIGRDIDGTRPAITSSAIVLPERPRCCGSMARCRNSPAHPLPRTPSRPVSTALV
jgi:hypothetical protein